MPSAHGVELSFRVGEYICPCTKELVPLLASRPLPFMEWPVVVEHCEGCGKRHVLECEDIHHLPAFGYE